ncbi:MULTISPECIES: hypothetical protein [unclassified Sphingomonas]|uniref:hypothetical protein n=1 Tax=unclassified Sphingomonas TaxID=196159 RepID=UPI00226A415F|nr:MULTISPECIES: hypothetical protein [unclassified Sphingomonas]
MTVVIRAFGDERLDTDLAAILKLPAAQEPSGLQQASATPLNSLRVSRRASATIAASLTFALLTSAGLVLLNYKPSPEADTNKGERLVTELIPAAKVAPADAADAAIATPSSSPVEHRHGRATASIRSRPAYAARASSAEPSSGSPTNVANADAPVENSLVASASTSIPVEVEASLEPARSAADTPAATAEHEAIDTEAQLAAKKTRRDSIAAIRMLRRQ